MKLEIRSSNTQQMLLFNCRENPRHMTRSLSRKTLKMQRTIKESSQGFWAVSSCLKWHCQHVTALSSEEGDLTNPTCLLVTCLPWGEGCFRLPWLDDHNHSINIHRADAIFPGQSCKDSLSLDTGRKMH